MNRRDFLKLLGGAGLASTGLGSLSSAQAGSLHTGKVLLTIHLGGGWDHSSFADPAPMCLLINGLLVRALGGLGIYALPLLGKIPHFSISITVISCRSMALSCLPMGMMWLHVPVIRAVY